MEPNQGSGDKSGSCRRTSSRTPEKQEASIPAYHRSTDKLVRIRGFRGVSTSRRRPAIEGWGGADLGGEKKAEESVRGGGPTEEVDRSCSKLEDQQQEIQHSVSSCIT